MRHAFESGEYPYTSRMRRAVYERRRRPLQVELLPQGSKGGPRWDPKESGEKIVVLFEGRDAAGKGG